MQIPTIDSLSELNIPYKKKINIKCDGQDLVLYGRSFFMNWNEEFVKKYNMFIIPLLKKMYIDYVVPFEKGTKIVGIFPLPDTSKEKLPNYSFLNKMSSHYTAFSILVNYLNIRILSKEPQIIFNDNLDNWIIEFKKFEKLIKDFKEDIFTDGKPVFNELYFAICRSHRIGESSECKMIDYLKKIFTKLKDEDIIKGGLGVSSDMIGGIDIEFTYNGKKCTLQNKKCDSVDFDGDKFTIRGISGANKYNTTHLGFEDKNGFLYIFKNIKVEFIPNYNMNVINMNYLYSSTNKEFVKIQMHKCTNL